MEHRPTLSSCPPGGARRRLAAFGALALVLAACAPCRDTGLARLYFGRALPGGGEVDEAAWRDFLVAEVTPRFPAGFTVLDAAGQWREPGGRIIAERSKVVEIAGPVRMPELDAIRGAYKLRFRQDSVGLVTVPACVDF